ncbi:MAG TPA: hypothetical protein VNG90_02155 [Candidatus Acidoferrum sp.]|nr:hypothetical protein [Candidatus Acidoferrum sp.]
MSTYATDTFLTGARGAPNAWSPGSDGANWTQSRSNQSLSFASNQGTMTYNGNTTTGIMTYSALTTTDTEVLVNAIQNNNSTSIIGAVCRFKDTSNFYSAVIGNTAGLFEIRKDLAGTFSTVASASFSSSSGTKYTIRFNITATALKAKIWQAGTAEPTAWTIPATTDSSISSGLFGVAGTPSAPSTSVSFDTFTATNGLTPSVIFVSSIMGPASVSGGIASQ